MVEFITA